MKAVVQAEFSLFLLLELQALPVPPASGTAAFRLTSVFRSVF
jgi:hypothetical protein